jgi:hypothetical protein
VRIVGPATAPPATILTGFRDQVAQRAATPAVGEALATATEVISWTWTHAERYRLDPVGLVAQVALETGWLTFPGRIDGRWRNPAGIKVRDPRVVAAFIPAADPDHPLTHAMFPSWSIGCLAHAQHIAAYAGTLEWSDLPVVDPRVAYVTEPAAEVWADLGGRWAPPLDYGDRIARVVSTMLAPLNRA